jgi:hypothetical protein
MRRTMVGPFGDDISPCRPCHRCLIVGSPAVDAWRPLITCGRRLASAGSWKGWLPGTENRGMQMSMDRPLHNLLSSMLGGAL